MSKPWFRFYGGEYLSDTKIRSLTSFERSCWITLLCYASTSTVEGEIMYLPENQLMLDAGVRPQTPYWDATVGVLKKLESLNMVKVDDSGIIQITNWNKRQYKRYTGYERIKRFRERNKGREQNEKIKQESFEEFWNLYPRKVSKKKAQESWDKIRPDDELKELIMAGLKRVLGCEQWTKDDGKFIPHPATWLIQERWNDEITVTTSRKVTKI